jgi:hypothetical protein
VFGEYRTNTEEVPRSISSRTLNTLAESFPGITQSLQVNDRNVSRFGHKNSLRNRSQFIIHESPLQPPYWSYRKPVPEIRNERQSYPAVQCSLVRVSGHVVIQGTNTVGHVKRDLGIFNGDRLCGLVVRVLGYKTGGPGSIPGTTRTKVVSLERGPLSLGSTTEELLDRKVAAHV